MGVLDAHVPAQKQKRSRRAEATTPFRQC